MNVSDEDIRTSSYLIGSLIYHPRASAGTCLRLRLNVHQFNRSADDGGAIIALIVPCLRNITLNRGIFVWDYKCLIPGEAEGEPGGSLVVSSSNFSSATRGAAVIVTTLPFFPNLKLLE